MPTRWWHASEFMSFLCSLSIVHVIVFTRSCSIANVKLNKMLRQRIFLSIKKIDSHSHSHSHILLKCNIYEWTLIDELLDLLQIFELSNYRQVGEIVLEEKPVIWGPKQLSPTSCLGKQERKDDIRMPLFRGLHLRPQRFGEQKTIFDYFCSPKQLP